MTNARAEDPATRPDDWPVGPEAPPRPDLFLIGAPKCGTSALAAWLAEREDVFFTDPKEPFFLADDIPHGRGLSLVPDLQAYAGLFSGADPARHRVIAEGSTNYLRSRRAVRRAIEISPEARFIVMLRDPVEIAHAFHMEQRFARNEDEPDFERAWALQERRAAGESLPAACYAPDALRYREVAAIGTQLERLLSEIEPARCLVLLQDDLKADPGAAWRRTLDFLGLPDDGRESFPRVNAAHAHRFEGLADLWLDPPPPLRPGVVALRTLLRRARVPAVERLKAAMRRPSPRRPMAPAFRARLVAEFEPEVRRVEALLGRDLSAWRETAGDPPQA